MSRLSPFSPSQVKAIWLPSGEKDGCVSLPTKLVKGVIFRSGNAEECLKTIRQPTAVMSAPNARKRMGCAQRLLTRMCGCGGASIDRGAASADDSAFSEINSFENSGDIFRTSGKKRWPRLGTVSIKRSPAALLLSAL